MIVLHAIEIWMVKINSLILSDEHGDLKKDGKEFEIEKFNDDANGVELELDHDVINICSKLLFVLWKT